MAITGLNGDKKTRRKGDLRSLTGKKLLVDTSTWLYVLGSSYAIEIVMEGDVQRLVQDLLLVTWFLEALGITVTHVLDGYAPLGKRNFVGAMPRLVACYICVCVYIVAADWKSVGEKRSKKRQHNVNEFLSRYQHTWEGKKDIRDANKVAHGALKFPDGLLHQIALGLKKGKVNVFRAIEEADMQIMYECKMGYVDGAFTVDGDFLVGCGDGFLVDIHRTLRTIVAFTKRRNANVNSKFQL